MLALKGINTQETKEINQLVDKMTHQILHRKISSPNQTAEQMFDLFESVIEKSSWHTVAELLHTVKLVSEQLAKKDRMNFVVRNCAERMMKIIKNLGEEHKQQLNSNIESLNAFKKIELTRTASKDDQDAE